VNRSLLVTGLALIDVCWLYPWSLLVAIWIGGEVLLSPLSMLVLLLAGAFLTLAVLETLGARRAGQFTLVALALLMSLLAVRLDHYAAAGMLDWLPNLGESVAIAMGHPTPPAIALALALLLWRRGVQIGSSSPTLPDVDSAFRWSIGALIGFALLLALAIRPSVQPALEARATPFVVGSFFVSLLTLALARLESLRTRTQAIGLNTQWLGVLIAVAGLLVLTALVVSQVLSFDLLVLATRPLFQLLGRVLILLLYAIVIPLAYVVELLAYWLLSLFSPDTENQPPEPPQASDIESLLRSLSQMVPPEVLGMLKIVSAIAVLALTLLLVARTISRWRPRGTEIDEAREERESVWQAGQLRETLLAWLRRLLRRDRAVAASAVAAASNAAAIPPAISSVREIYRNLLKLGEAAGSLRQPASTPYEHEPSLESELEPGAAIAELTEAYVQVRYAEAEPSAEELTALHTQLDAVRPSEP
jgi:hypothetical protein